jgi:hypothetical protein
MYKFGYNETDQVHREQDHKKDYYETQYVAHVRVVDMLLQHVADCRVTFSGYDDAGNKADKREHLGD